MNPKTIRETAGLSVRELAEKMDVSTQRIYAIEAADDWMVSTIEAYYKACAGPVGPESRGLLLLASRCLSGSLERWVSGRGSQEAVEADFQNLCDTWRREFGRGARESKTCKGYNGCTPVSQPDGTVSCADCGVVFYGSDQRGDTPAREDSSETPKIGASGLISKGRK